MKRISIILGLLVFALAIASCGGPKADAKKMVKISKKYAEAIKAAVEDEKIEDGEADKINELSKEMGEFMEEMEKKYEDDEDGQKEMEEAMEEAGKDLEDTYDEAFEKLWDCEGIDKLDW